MIKLGLFKASEVLLFNRRLNAVEAFERNLVNQVVPEKDFKKVCDEKLALFAKIPQNVTYIFSCFCYFAYLKTLVKQLEILDDLCIYF